MPAMDFPAASWAVAFISCHALTVLVLLLMLLLLLQVQLDGTVRSSGAGTPPWERFVSDLPPLDSMRTQITDGIGTSV